MNAVNEVFTLSKHDGKVCCDILVHEESRKRGISTTRMLDFFYSYQRPMASEITGHVFHTVEESLKFGLEINNSTAKHRFTKIHEEGDFTIQGEKITEVEHFKFLGSCVISSGDSTTEIRTRLSMAGATTMLPRSFRSRSVKQLLQDRTDIWRKVTI